MQAYIDGPYIFDPYYQAQLDGLPDGAYRLRDIAPDNFKKTEYYKHYYMPSLLADELCYLVTLGDNEYLHFSITPADISSKFPQKRFALFKQPAHRNTGPNPTTLAAKPATKNNSG